MRTLTFSNEHERKGAEIIINNVCRAFGVMEIRTAPNANEIAYEKVPDEVFDFAMQHEDWNYIEDIGRFQSLGEYYPEIEKEFQNESNKGQQIAAIRTKISQIIGR